MTQDLDQHALVMARESLHLTREEDNQDPAIISSNITPQSHATTRVLLTLTLDSAQVSALVSAAGVETIPLSSPEPTSRHHSTLTSKPASRTTTTSTRTTSFPTTRAVVRIANTPDAQETFSWTVADVPSSPNEEPAATPVETSQSGRSANSNFSSPSSIQYTTSSGLRTSGSSSQTQQDRNSDDGSSSSRNSDSSRSSSSSTQSSTAVRSVTTTITSTMTTSSRSYTSTRLFSTTVVVKPVITGAATVSDINATDAEGGNTDNPATGTSASSVSSTSTAKPENSFKSFLSSIDSSPTAIALTVIIFVGVSALIALGIFLCLRRRSRKAKRKASLLHGEADARSITSLYSEKDSLYPFYAPMKTPEDTDSQHVEAPSSIAPISPKSGLVDNGTTSGVRLAGIYPTLPPLRRKSVMDLTTTLHSEDPTTTTASIPTFQVDDRYASANPFADVLPSSSTALNKQASTDVLQVPRRPARPASLTNSFKREIDEALAPSPQPSVDSFLPAPPQPWIRPARKWASMSSAAGSTDRRLFQQQMPSRFSITTLGTSGQPSPDLGNYRPRRTAITGQNIVESMLRTDIFGGTNEISSTGEERVVDKSQNPFSDSAQVLPNSVPILGEGMSPTCSNLPWHAGSTAPIEDPSIAQGILADQESDDGDSDHTANDNDEDDEEDDQDENDDDTLSRGSETTSGTAVEGHVRRESNSDASGVGEGSEALEIDSNEETEAEEAQLRSLIRRRQSASEGL